MPPSLPNEVERDILAFQKALTLALGAGGASNVADAVRDLADWSLRQGASIRFVPRGNKKQSTVAFALMPSGRTLWKTYPTGAKIEFLVRSSNYLSATSFNNCRGRLSDAGLRLIEGAVLTAPLQAITTATGLAAAKSFCGWAVTQADFVNP